MLDIVKLTCPPIDCLPGVDSSLSQAMTITDLARVFLLERTGLIKSDNVQPESRFSRTDQMSNAWDCAADSDLWGLLGHLIKAHPEWSDKQCRDILREWTTIRRSSPWQASLHTDWRRWKQHHNDLKAGLVHAGNLSWVQLCRYCEIWSANRPVMSPFSRVAEILLESLENIIVPAVPSASGFLSSVTNKCFTAMKNTKATSNSPNKKVLIVTGHLTKEDFLNYEASRQLISALEIGDFSWSLYQPWDKTVEFDPKTIQGVFFWSYIHLANDFVYHAMAFEEQCIAKKIPILNSIYYGWDTRHSTLLENMKIAEIPCPRYQKFIDVDDIELNYPLILRVDGLHRGQQMHFVQNKNEAEELMNSTRIEFLSPNKKKRVMPPPNLAVEFIDVADKSGQYNKRRAIVVGNKVLFRHQLTSNSWLVNFSSSDFSETSIIAHKQYIAGDEDGDIELILSAARATGSEVTALDYSKTETGDLVFWEANRIFIMNGDPGYGSSVATYPDGSKRRVSNDFELGECLAMLVKEQLAHAVT
jgi:hypothetical protein